MQNYNGNDERSRAVDHVQRSVSSRKEMGPAMACEIGPWTCGLPVTLDWQCWLLSPTLRLLAQFPFQQWTSSTFSGSGDPGN